MKGERVDEQSMKGTEQLETSNSSKLADKLSAAGWALFFIWVGIALLMKVPMGVGLLGVGVITLVVQLTRKCLNLTLEGFWVVIGLLFIVGGLWALFEPKLPLVPILLIVAGSVLLVSVVRHLTR